MFVFNFLSRNKNNLIQGKLYVADKPIVNYILLIFLKLFLILSL